MAERFRLLQISDLHVAETSYLSEGGRPYLRRFGFQKLVEKRFRPAHLTLLNAVARAAYRNRPLDAILITGDLANWGDAPSLQAAYGFVASEPAHQWHDAAKLPTLRGSKVPVHLLPGNHDRFARWGYGGAGGILFDERFGAYWKVRQSVSFFTLRDSFGVVMGDLTLASVSDSTSLHGAWGQGKAYVERIAFMKVQTELLRARHKDIAIIWAVHFAPAFDGLPEYLELIDHGHLIAAAEELGIHHILCGHTHEQRLYPVGNGGSIKVYCAGSAAVKEEPRKTLHLFEIEVDRGSFSRFDLDILEFDEVDGFLERKPDELR